ncbi:MAG: penicillin-binding protein 2 [Chloroflexia bacterium]
MKRSTLLVFYALIGLSFLALGARLVQMQIVEGHTYQVQAEGNRIRRVSVKAPRGIVYDRDLRQLISNQPSFSVAVTAADLPEAAGEQTAVFETLAGLLHTAPVVTGVPYKMLAGDIRAAQIITGLAALLNVPPAGLVSAIEDGRKVSPADPALLRRDLSPQLAAAISAHAKDWPGIEVMNELQYNYIIRSDRPFLPVTVKSNIPFETMLRVEEEHLRLPGVSVVPEPYRQYSFGSFMSHILGYVGPIPEDQYKASLPPDGSGDPSLYERDAKVGLLGIEASLEPVLRGTKGAREIEVNSHQREVREISNQPPTPGQNVVLTIDSALQISVTHLLQAGIDQAHAATAAHAVTSVGGGVAIVEKVQTGEILAMVSLPSYDDNLFAAGISQEDFDRLNSDPNSPMFDRAIGGAYPPGSTFKMITAAAGLQVGVVTPQTQIFDPGHIDVPLTYDENSRTKYYSWNRTGLGSVNILQALQQSSDIYFFEVAGPGQKDAAGNMTRFYMPGNPRPQYFNGLGITRFYPYMAEFGFGSPTGIRLPGEVAGVAPNPDWKISHYPNDNWSLGDTLSTAVGQGFDLATPLQLANATAAVANGGTLYQPQIVRRILESDGGTVVQDFQPNVIRHIHVDPANLALIREGMRMAVADPAKGTAHKADLQGVHIAGKTGTAEIGDVIDAQGHRRAHAWFTSFAPYENPEIAVTVLIEAGDQSLEGSTFAVPVARAIYKAYYHLNESP